MRILLDENLPRQLKSRLAEHHTSSVSDMRWKGISNGALLQRAEGRFDVMLTADKNIYAQQNLSGRTISILVLPTNNRVPLLALAQQIRDVLAEIQPSTYVTIASDGTVVRRRFAARSDQTEG
jgi:predicted nuclease of predicted toxin-antitoxin system